MGKPKKRTSPRKSGLRRSHLVLELARKVNGQLSKVGSAIKIRTTKRESGKQMVAKDKAKSKASAS